MGEDGNSEADEFTATVETVTVEKDGTLADQAIEEAITNVPSDAKSVDFTNNVDTSQVGDQTVTVTITFADDSTKDVDVTVTVTEPSAG
jgi:Rib/alpha/Esp surface antigen-like repeat protein